MTKKMWGGRFKKPTNNKVELFTSSIDQDKKLYEHDINGSIAHVQMLSKQGIISKTESNKIINGLEKIRVNIKSNRFALKDSLEDIHMNIESALIKNIGDVGKKSTQPEVGTIKLQQTLSFTLKAPWTNLSY